MSTRGIVLIVSVAVVIVIGAIAGAVYLSRGFFSDAMQMFAEGARFGRGKEAQACVDEAVRRYDPEQTMVKQTLDSGFVVACLSGAKVSGEFCDAVPPTKMLDQAGARSWAVEQCRENDLEGQGCELIFLQVANYCRSKR